MNATVAAQISPERMVKDFDSVWIDFSKGLGEPFRRRACRPTGIYSTGMALKQKWGGAMRQAGILAAAGLYALRYNIDGLLEDSSTSTATC